MGDTTATSKIHAKKLPIVIVPGTMGTRLSVPFTNELVWNPTADRGIFAANDAILRDMTRTLVPDEKNGFPVHHDNFVPTLNIRHVNNIIFDFYGAIALAMQHDLRKKLAPKQVVPVVYCCGYDFRVDNRISAQRLSSIVNEAQAECDGEKAIIIAHSMGGLITRHYCKNLGGEDKVRAIVLLASPTHGAPDAYFTLRSGLDEIFPLRLVLFMTQETSRQFTRVMPSVYQLLPTIQYSKLDPNWISFDGSQTGFLPDPPIRQEGPKFSDGSENFFVYRDIYTGLMDDVALRDLSSQHLKTALDFDGGLLVDADSTYMHKTSILVAGTKLGTKGKAQVVLEGVAQTGGKVVAVSRVVEQNKVDGDKTVPLISGNPQRIKPDTTLRREFEKVEHQKVPATRSVIDHVMERIDELF
jgi:hypothetical protein